MFNVQSIPKQYVHIYIITKQWIQTNTCLHLSISSTTDWLFGIEAKLLFTNTALAMVDSRIQIPAIPGHNITVVCTANVSEQQFTTLTLSGSFGRREDNNFGQTSNLVTKITLGGEDLSLDTRQNITCSLKKGNTDMSDVYGIVTTSCKHEILLLKIKSSQTKLLQRIITKLPYHNTLHNNYKYTFYIFNGSEWLTEQMRNCLYR